MMMHNIFEKRNKQQEQTLQLVSGLAGIAIGATAGVVFADKENRKKIMQAFQTASRKTTNMIQAVKKELHDDEVENKTEPTVKEEKI